MATPESSGTPPPAPAPPVRPPVKPRGPPPAFPPPPRPPRRPLAAPSGGHPFFCTSGGEANEGAFKFARKWWKKTEIVAFSGSFHGRLFASLAATDRPDYRRPFEPLLAGVQIIPLGDEAAATRAISAQRTAAG